MTRFLILKLQEQLFVILEYLQLVWIESPTNPLIKVVDIEAITELCHKLGNVIVAVDNTFLTSYFQRPLELGADLVCYSLTKYMNGHTDVVMGGITMNSEDLYNRLKFLQNGKEFAYLLKKNLIIMCQITPYSCWHSAIAIRLLSSEPESQDSGSANGTTSKKWNRCC